MDPTTLENLLLLPSPLEPLFIAINFINPASISFHSTLSHGTQVGIAILDTKDLHYPSADQELNISTSNYITGPHRYIKSVTRNDIFTTTQHIPSNLSKISERITELIPRERNIILVGHDFNEDTQALHKLGFDFSSSILGYFDTHLIAQKLKFEEMSLGGILRALGCPTRNLCNAGNKANFILRALVLLGKKVCGEVKVGDWYARIKTMEVMMIMPLSVFGNEGVKKEGNDVRKMFGNGEMVNVRERERHRHVVVLDIIVEEPSWLDDYTPVRQAGGVGLSGQGERLLESKEVGMDEDIVIFKRKGENVSKENRASIRQMSVTHDRLFHLDVQIPSTTVKVTSQGESFVRFKEVIPEEDIVVFKGRR